MNKNKINSLYTLIKEQSIKKDRPLKIITDWDECLFAFRPISIYRVGNIKRPFKEFFLDYWEKTTVDSRDGSSAHKTFAYDAPKGEEKIAYEEWNKFSVKKDRYVIKGDDKLTLKEKEEYERIRKMLSNRFDDPFLSFSEDLLKCLKEDLISELVIVSATGSKSSKPSPTTVVKNERFAKTFAKFSNANLTVIKVWKTDGKNRIHRWEWIKEHHPDFDIFVDDDKGWIKSVREHFGLEKIYAINDYKYSRDLQANNIYRVKTTVSDLKDSDFALVALEKKLESLEKEVKEEVGMKRRNPYIYPIFLVIIGTTILGVLTYFSLIKTKKVNKW